MTFQRNKCFSGLICLLSTSTCLWACLAMISLWAVSFGNEGFFPVLFCYSTFSFSVGLLGIFLIFEKRLGDILFFYWFYVFIDGLVLFGLCIYLFLTCKNEFQGVEGFNEDFIKANLNEIVMACLTIVFTKVFLKFKYVDYIHVYISSTILEIESFIKNNDIEKKLKDKKYPMIK
jgi:hypothetical protein